MGDLTKENRDLKEIAQQLSLQLDQAMVQNQTLQQYVERFAMLHGTTTVQPVRYRSAAPQNWTGCSPLFGSANRERADCASISTGLENGNFAGGAEDVPYDVLRFSLLKCLREDRLATVLRLCSDELTCSNGGN